MEYRIYVSWNRNPMGRTIIARASSLEEARRIADHEFYNKGYKIVEVGMIDGSRICPCVYHKQRP